MSPLYFVTFKRIDRPFVSCFLKIKKLYGMKWRKYVMIVKRINDNSQVGTKFLLRKMSRSTVGRPLLYKTIWNIILESSMTFLNVILI